MDISTLSLTELRALEANVADRIVVVLKDTQAAARSQIAAIAKAAGLSLSDLHKIDQVKPKPPAKFRHPEQPELEWSGMGRRPAWVVEWIEADKSMEALAVK